MCTVLAYFGSDMTREQFERRKEGLTIQKQQNSRKGDSWASSAWPLWG